MNNYIQQKVLNFNIRQEWMLQCRNKIAVIISKAVKKSVKRLRLFDQKEASHCGK